MKSLPTNFKPDSICVLRLSALGDICHTLPVIRTLQNALPGTSITWVIGKAEFSMIGDIPGIEFIVFDKNGGISAYSEFRKKMKGRNFDVLLHMQMALRASLISCLIPTKIRIGFDRKRAKDLQWLFTNYEIPRHDRQHVMESLFGFTEALNITQQEHVWNIPLPNETIRKCDKYIETNRKYAVINPCSAHPYRNWDPIRYAEVSDYIADNYGFKIVLTGGQSSIEKDYGETIKNSARNDVTNLIGKTTLKELLVILSKAQFVIAPDTGPAHMANAMHKPVVGLYATTNPDRARPYNSKEFVVNRYDDAVLEKYRKLPSQLPWGLRVKDKGTMQRITTMDVISKVDKLLKSNNETTPA